MNRSELMREIRSVLKEKVKAQEAVIRYDSQLEYLRLQMDIAQEADRAERIRHASHWKEIDDFKTREINRLCEDDYRHLEQLEYNCLETADYIGCAERTVRNLLSKGKLRPGVSDRPGRGGERTVSSISAVEYWLDGGTQEEQE